MKNSKLTESIGAVAAIENVHCNMRRLRHDDDAIGRAIAEGRLVVRGAVHDLASGELRPVEDPRRPEA